MQIKVDYMLGLSLNSSPIKYWIYSLHDTQVSNLMFWLHNTNVEADFFEYASQVIFELKFD